MDWLQRFPLTLGLVALGVLPGCSDHDPFGDPLIMSAPTATRASVTWYDEGRDELLVARPGEDDLSLERIPIGDERTTLQWKQATVGGDALLMMLVPANDKVEEVDDTLVIVSADGDGEPREIVRWKCFTPSVFRRRKNGSMNFPISFRGECASA